MGELGASASVGTALSWGAIVDWLQALTLPSLDLVALAIVTFLGAGIIKGIVGFGLPTVALSILAATLGLKAAIALTVFPSLLTNVWQSLTGGHLFLLLRRLSVFLIAICLGVLLGTILLTQIDSTILTVLLGSLIVIYAVAGLARWQPPAARENERWLAPVVGTVNGTVTGLTGSFIMPGLLYLRSLDLPRNQMIQAMGLVFLISTAALGGFLARASLMPEALVITSLSAVPAAFVGMWIGQAVRRRLSDVAFDRAFYIGLLVVGSFLIARNVGLT